MERLLESGDVKLPSVQFSRSVTTDCDPMGCSTPGFPVHHQLLELAQTHVHRVSDAIQTSHPASSLLLLPSVFPSIRVFFNESVLPIRWPKYWSFSFNISPSNEYSGLISFRMDWLDLLALKGLWRVFSNITVQKQQFFGAQLSFCSNSLEMPLIIVVIYVALHQTDWKLCCILAGWLKKYHCKIIVTKKDPAFRLCVSRW